MAVLRERADQRDDHLLPTPIAQCAKLALIPFSSIRPFRGHPFRLYTGERLVDMAESIRQNGILMPLIIRRTYDDPNRDYEMLSGHNRMNAGAIAGLTEALCLVKEDISDAEALMYVIETNLMQRSFTDLLPSEKAAVLALRYSEMFSQGKRNDIIRELRLLEDPNAKDAETCGTGCHKSKNRDALGLEYGLKGRMVAGYLRIDKLIDNLKLCVDMGSVTLKAGITLSYLSAQEQQAVANTLCGCKRKLTEVQAAAIRQRCKEDTLTMPTVKSILQGKASPKPKGVQVRRETYAPYFSDETPAKEIEQVIAEALRLYFEQKEASA